MSANVLFSGIGCQERGIEDSKLFDLEVNNTSDISKESILSYAAVHCGLTPEMVEAYDKYPAREQMVKELKEKNIGYIPEKNKEYAWERLLKKPNKELEKYWLAMKLTHNAGDISKIDKLSYADLWTCSFPCFTGDTLVLTESRGYVPIKEVEVGDRVLTHTNEYKNVIKSWRTGRKNIYELSIAGVGKIKCTENHRFYVRTKEKGKFGEPAWKECKDFTYNDYIGYAIDNESKSVNWVEDVNDPIYNLLNTYCFWYLIGCFLLNGKVLKEQGIDKGIIISIPDEYMNNRVLDAIKSCKLDSVVNIENGVVKEYIIYSTTICDIVKKFYNADGDKIIPSDVIHMPREQIIKFLYGYKEMYEALNNFLVFKVEADTKELAVGLIQLFAKGYRKAVILEEEQGKFIIRYDGFTVSTVGFYEENYIWYRMEGMIDTGVEEDVYDLMVEDAHSFTANGYIAHNCTDISIAGKMKGLAPNAETRSSLLWENIRLLKKAKEDGEAPKYILFENVKNLVSKAFIKDFNELLAVLEELGYNSYWKVLNAKDCGVPQNRERVFVVSIRKDIDKGKFEFPRPFDMGVRLKHILDLKVDEKYYISKAIQDRFKLTDSTMTKNIIGTTKGREDAIGQRSLVYNSEGIVGALTATDYKQPKQFIDFDQIYIDNLNDSMTFVKRGIQALKDKKGMLPELFNAYNRVEIEDYAPTLTATCGSASSSAMVLKKEMYFRIRRLTPYECWKLMGFRSEDCKKAESLGLSMGHLYKQAGNGIVTNCVELIIEHLYKAQYDNSYECTDELFLQKVKGVV